MLDEREMQYLYKDGDSFHFMDTCNYEQMHIAAEALGDSVNYLIAETHIKVEFYGAEPVGIELPPTVDLKVEDTVPGIKGATASAQVKPATLETGLVVQVPPFVNKGDMIRVNTETGEYLVSRMNGPRGLDEPPVIGRHRTDSRTSGLDRSHHRQHVQRQERGADPPAAPRADRAAEGPDLQAARSTTASATTTSSRTARCGSRRRTSSSSRELLDARGRPTPKSSGIDEGQFFDAELPAVCNTLADQGKRVIVAGLDQDYLGKPFEPMPQLLAIAEYITKTLAICMVCGAPANHTQRLVASSERVLVGASGHVRSALPPLLRSASRAVARSSARSPACDHACELPRSLFVLGVGFLVTTSAVLQFIRFRGCAVGAADWPAAAALYGCSWLGAVLACSSSTSSRSCAGTQQVFGETMMLVYYVYALPLSARSAGASTRTGSGPTAVHAVLAHRRPDLAGRRAADAGPDLRMRAFARQPDGAGALLRRSPPLLRDKIAAHDIHFTGKTLDLGCTTNATTCQSGCTTRSSLDST